MQVKTRKTCTDSKVLCQGKKAHLDSGCAKPSQEMGGTCRPGKMVCGDSRRDHSKFKSINDLVRHYKRVHRPLLKGQLNCFVEQPDLEKVIQLACSKKIPCGARFPHLYRIPNSALKQWKESLQVSIKNSNGHSSFRSLWGNLTLIAEGISRIGKLTVYDASLKIGAFLDSPPHEVYLHAGTRKGAEVLGLPTNRKSIPLNEFQGDNEVIRRLEPFEVEDFLCIFKEELRELKSRSDKTTA